MLYIRLKELLVSADSGHHQVLSKRALWVVTQGA